MAERGRLCLLLLATAAVVPLVSDWYQGTTPSGSLRIVEVLRIGALLLLVPLVAPGTGEKSAVVVTLAGLATLAASGAWLGVLRGDLGPYLIVTGCTAFGCSVGLPWRVRHQALLALLFAAGLAAALPSIAADGWVRVNGNSVFAYLLSLASSVFMTSLESTRRRAALEAIDRTVGAGTALRELNESLEQRVADRTGELAEANRELESANVRLATSHRNLEAAYRELEGFTHSVSHDLRVPLRVINGLARVAVEEHGGSLGDEVRGYLRRIADEAVRLGEIGDDLLVLARVTRSSIVPVQVDASAMARDIAGELRSGCDRREVEVIVEDGLHVHAEPALLRVVLEQLLSNAWKFTRHRSPAEIRVGACVADGQAGFFVRDNGAGFAPEFAGKLFRPFERLHDDAGLEGRGIGLAIVHRIVTRHGGHIRAEGDRNRGATFQVTLPAPDHHFDRDGISSCKSLPCVPPHGILTSNVQGSPPGRLGLHFRSPRRARAGPR